MGRNNYDDDERDPLAEDTVEVIPAGTLATIVQNEIMAQMEAANRFPRDTKKFLQKATSLATYNEPVAMSCMFTLPRSDKAITGPSVRLAEIVAASWKNLHVGSRVVGIEDKQVVAQAAVWDLENNVRVIIEARRRITNKKGQRYNDDMITMTGNAAISIAFRNGVFRIVPRAYYMEVYDASRKVAVGDASTLVQKRGTVIERLLKMGAMLDRILHRVSVQSVEAIGLEHLEVLIGLGTAIKEGKEKVDDVFPAPEAETGTRGTVSMSQVREGKESNRGHGGENLSDVQRQAEQKPPAENGGNGGTSAAAQEQKPAEKTVDKAPEQKPEEKAATDVGAAVAAGAFTLSSRDPRIPQVPEPTEPDALLNDDQAKTLERAAKAHKLEMPRVVEFAKTLGYKLYSQVRQRHYVRILAFIQNKGVDVMAEPEKQQ